MFYYTNFYSKNFGKDFIPIIREQVLHSSLFSTGVSFPPWPNTCIHFATLLCEATTDVSYTVSLEGLKYKSLLFELKHSGLGLWEYLDTLTFLYANK